MSSLLFPLFALVLIFSQKVDAHPVAFADSIGIMGEHSPMITHNQINYSARHWLAFGVHHLRRPELPDRSATIATTNLLLKRWNAPAFQANIYAILGGGYSQLNFQEGGRIFSALQFDVEDRRWYFMAKHSSLFDGKTEDLRMTNVRGGFAPYLAPFEGLHTWLIVDWMNMDFANGFSMQDTTPMLRFFYQNVLFEIGQSFNGYTRFNYIIHY